MLDVTSTATGAVQSFPWSITIEPETLAVTSNRTVILSPGSYELALLVSEGNQQYAGTATAEITDGVNTVAMTLRPIIGDVVIDTQIVARLNDFRFAYDPAEVGTIADPRLGVAVDDGGETIFQLSRETGMSSSYVNLSDGAHHLDLRLYDGGLQIGRSVAAQEDVIAVPGVNILMDLVALAGETALSLDVAGGEARFTVVVPAEVVEEAGGLANLEARISLVGSTNAFQEKALSLVPGPTALAYQATAVFSDMQYGSVTAALTFADITASPIELLGSCTQEIALGFDGSNHVCNISLRRRAVIAGSLLATVGINVYDSSGRPVSGAAITSAGTRLGTTNSGFGSIGYAKLFLHAGPHTLVAAAEGRSGSATIDVAPLSINNIDITLAPVPETPVTLAFVDAASGQPVTTPLAVRIEGPGKAFVRDTTGTPRTSFEVSGGTLAIQISGEAQPSPVNPVNLSIIVTGEGVIGTSSLQRITTTDAVLISTPLIDAAAPPQGVTLTTNSDGVADGTGAVAVEVDLATNPDPQTGATATVTIPAGTVVTDSNGDPLSGQLTAQLAYFSPRQPAALLAFPGGLEVNVTDNPSGETNGLFKSAGMVSVEIRDPSGRVGQNFSGDGLAIEIEVSAGTVNPITSQIVVPGDQVPLWRSDTNTGEWHYEGEATAVLRSPPLGDLTGEAPRTVFAFHAKHLSLWNLDWFINVCGFSRVIRIVDNFLNPVPETTAQNFSYRIFIADSGGVVGGYIRDAAANAGGGGFNRVQFQNAPNVNIMRIIVFSAPGSTGTVLANRSFNTASDNGLCVGSGDLFLTVDI